MSNAFGHWTPDMVNAHNARVRGPKPGDGGRRAEPATNLDLTPQPSTDEDNLNKTERAYLWHLRKLNVPALRIQQFTLKLAHDCRLTVDFTYLNANGRMVFVDVKGHMREDAFIKMKMAARMFREFDFVFVKRDGASWEETPVPP